MSQHSATEPTTETEQRYYIYSVAGWLKSQTLASDLSLDNILKRLPDRAYGLREVSFQDYRKEQEYNNNPDNP